MKPLTLDKTWKECLRMWSDIIGWIKNGSTNNITSLKYRWLDEKNYPPIISSCFFCEYGNQQIIKLIKEGKTPPGDDTCSLCPAVLVNSRFNCNNRSYDYEEKPFAFYRKLVELNKKRLALRAAGRTKR